MTRLLAGLLCCLAFLLGQEARAQGTPFAPVAVVNGAAITGFDLEQRARLISLLADAKASPQEIRTVALDQLIEDRLKVQEATRMGFQASEEDVSEGFADFARQRGLEPGQLAARLQKAGVSELAVKDLVRADLMWNSLVRSRFIGRVEPADTEIDAEIGLIASGRQPTAYRLQEIGLPIENGDEEASLRQAQELYAVLANGADFTAAVRQYSRAPSAANEGQLGWIDAARLPPELGETLAALQPGQISPPIRFPAGYSIVKLLETRGGGGPAVADVTPEQRERVRKRMIEQRVGRLSEGLLQELRRDALIQLR